MKLLKNIVLLHIVGFLTSKNTEIQRKMRGNYEISGEIVFFVAFGRFRPGNKCRFVQKENYENLGKLEFCCTFQTFRVRESAGPPGITLE